MDEASDGRLELNPDQQRADELAELKRLNEQEEGELFRVTDEIAAMESVRLQIVRVLPSDKKGFVGEMLPQEFTMERIRRLYGAGRYRIRILGPRGYLPGGGTVEIAEVAQEGPTDLKSILDELDQRNREAQSQKSGRMLEYITALAPLFAPLIGKMVGGGTDVAALVAALKPPPAPTMPELMTALASLKSLAPEQTVDPIDRALKIMDAIGEKGGGGGETNWTDVFKELVKAVGPNIGGVLEGAMSRAAATTAVPRLPSGSPTPPLNALPNVVGTAGTSNGNGGESNMLLSLLPWLRGQLEMLLVKAARGNDPVLYAEVLLDSLPDGLNPETLYGFIQRTDWFKYVVQLDSRAATYEPWFARLRAAMLQAFSDPDPSGAGASPVSDISASEGATPAGGTIVAMQDASGRRTIEIDRPPQGPPSLTGE